MAVEYIYLKEYLALINNFNNRWGGKVIRRHSDQISREGLSYAVGRDITPTLSESEHVVSDILSLESYPAYETEIDSVPVSMAFSGEDIFNVSLRYDLKWEIKVRHENMIDKISKKLRLDWEFQTGDADFDKKYYIECKDATHRPIFLDATFRSLVEKLEPFDRLVTTAKRLGTSRPIDNPNLLDPSTMKDFLEALLRTAKYMKK